jgi:GT2 family glycosyltransferase
VKDSAAEASVTKDPNLIQEVLEELRALRRERDRGDDALWDAIEELRTVVEPGDKPNPAGSKMSAVEYRRMKRRFRRFVEREAPPGARVAVVSRGDDELLSYEGVTAVHFPQDTSGGYAGFYPSDGTGVIAHLAWLVARGVEWLAIPSCSAWWLESYPEFGRHLAVTAAVPIEDERAGILYRLDGWESGERTYPDRIAALCESWRPQLGDPSVLEWTSGPSLEKSMANERVFSPPENDDELPYLDESVDIVVVDERERLAEARRVARRSVVLVERGTRPKIEHMEDAPPPLPSVSIVIPTRDGWRHLDPCLRGLQRTLPESFEGEVIVVDDGSSAGTRRSLADRAVDLPWLRVVRNPRNVGFILSCNRGAEEADGTFVVFLNDDTVPVGSWLQALIGTFSIFPDAGAVGGRLVYPDGRLQEAGGLIYSDGTGANIGRGDWHVDAARYRWVRQVDYSSGALLATPKALFSELGGFSHDYLPAYYEDTDYCFRVREANRRVYYQPSAVVVHTEGASSGVDPASGAKRYQARNREIFLNRWGDSLTNRARPPRRYSERTWESLTLLGRPGREEVA